MKSIALATLMIAMTAASGSTASAKRESVAAPCTVAAPTTCVVETTLTCAFDPVEWTVLVGPFHGETVCNESTTTGPLSYDDVRCDAGIEIGVPIYSWSLVTTIYRGNVTRGESESDPLLGPVYHQVREHARAIWSAPVAGDSGPAYDLAGPTGSSC